MIHRILKASALCCSLSAPMERHEPTNNITAQAATNSSLTTKKQQLTRNQQQDHKESILRFFVQKVYEEQIFEVSVITRTTEPITFFE